MYTYIKYNSVRVVFTESYAVNSKTAALVLISFKNIGNPLHSC